MCEFSLKSNEAFITFSIKSKLSQYQGLMLFLEKKVKGPFTYQRDSLQFSLNEFNRIPSIITFVRKNSTNSKSEGIGFDTKL